MGGGIFQNPSSKGGLNSRAFMFNSYELWEKGVVIVSSIIILIKILQLLQKQTGFLFNYFCFSSYQFNFNNLCMLSFSSILKQQY